MKKLLAIVMTFAIAFGICSLAFASEDGFITTVDSVTDVPEGWTAIRTAEDLNNIRNDLAGKYILMNDIDLSVYDNWSPIGDATTPFTGILDGNGYTIENMKITVAEDEEAEYAAFFGATQNATISNLTIVCDIDVLSAIGSDKHIRVAAFVGKDIENTTFSNCVANGSILTDTDSYISVGGMITSFNGHMNDCRNEVNLDIKSTRNKMGTLSFGGLTAYNDGVICKSTNIGNISVIYDGSELVYAYIGGISAHTGDWGELESKAEILNCYNAGNISADNFHFASIGGISAFVIGNVYNSYNYGKLVSSSDRIAFDSIGPEIMFWSDDPLGLGFPKTKLSELKNCYYIETEDVGTYDEELAVNVKMLSAEEFAKQESFEGFDFENVWVMDEELGRPVFLDENAKEITTTETTIATTITESTTEVSVTESTTVTDTETTTEVITEQEYTTEKATLPETTETSTEEPTTAPVIETTTEGTTQTSNDDCWFDKLLSMIEKVWTFIISVVPFVC